MDLSTMIISKLFSSLSDISDNRPLLVSSSDDNSVNLDNSEGSLLKSPTPSGSVDLSKEPLLSRPSRSPDGLANCTVKCPSPSIESARDMLRNAGYSEGDIESVILRKNSEVMDYNPYGRDRPTTHVFYQGKVFTYPKLEVPKQSKRKKQTRNPMVEDNDANLLVLDPDASSSVPANQDHHTHILASLKNIRIKNLNNVIIGLLNINSIRNKFHALQHIIHGNVDILIITETKIDHTFPQNQFRIPGFRLPYRKDRDGYGGGVMIYVREDIPSDILTKHNMDPKMEAIFIEVNLRKTKILLIAVYNSPSIKYRVPEVEFFEQIAHALDVYSGYDKFVIAGDLNINAFSDVDGALDDFMDEFHAKNLVKEPTCFANPENPSCLDLYITNSHRSFQGTTAVATGLSDCHKMVITVLKTTFPKADPRVITYRDYSSYCVEEFGRDLQRNLELIEEGEYQSFENVFIDTLGAKYPTKKKTIRANQQPYVTREMRKSIMTRSRLQKRYWNYGTEECRLAMKRQENYCNKLYKKERKNLYKNLDPKFIEDERKFWLTMKPFFTDKNSSIREKILLIENGELVVNDAEIAETFNAFFSNSVNTLGIVENKLLLNPVSISDVGVEKCIKMYETHPSIVNIRRHVKVDHEFYFRPITAADMEKKIAALNPRKNGGEIPTKILREMRQIVSEPLAKIWSEQCVVRKVFPDKLKLGDITAVYKALEKTEKELQTYHCFTYYIQAL